MCILYVYIYIYVYKPTSTYTYIYIYIYIYIYVYGKVWWASGVNTTLAKVELLRQLSKLNR